MKYLKNINILLIVGLLLFSGDTFSQLKNINKIEMTGNLLTDSKIINEQANKLETLNILPDVENRKNPMLAGLFSAIIPGGGEFYTGNYLKSIIFVAVEAALITTAVVNNNNANDKTQSFQNFANKNWDVKRYVQWTINNVQNINPSVDPNNFVVVKQDGSVDFSELNKFEAALGAGYSHQLPAFGEQQYYELIGKYPQYSHGWNDSNQNDTDFHILSPNFLSYSRDRGIANDIFNRADRAIIGIYINHLLSVIDAIWSTTRYNSRISMKVKVQNQKFAGEYSFVPTLNIQYRF